jgi:hypothetical protein
MWLVGCVVGWVNGWSNWKSSRGASFGPQAFVACFFPDYDWRCATQVAEAHSAVGKESDLVSTVVVRCRQCCRTKFPVFDGSILSKPAGGYTAQVMGVAPKRPPHFAVWVGSNTQSSCSPGAGSLIDWVLARNGSVFGLGRVID